MENIFKYLRIRERRFNSYLQVSSIGIIPEKKDRIKRTFKTYNFSFIFQGNGSYRHKGKEYEVNAPCVITQWPGEPMDYGPFSTWYECFLIYPEKCGDYLRDRGLITEQRFMWRPNDPSRIKEMLTELEEMLLAANVPPDRIDLLCESIILESLLERYPLQQNIDRDLIFKIRDQIKSNIAFQPDFKKLAKNNGMSLSTFRRQWLKYVNVPIGRYLTGQRINEASRLLVETTLPVGEIAF